MVADFFLIDILEGAMILIAIAAILLIGWGAIVGLDWLLHRYENATLFLLGIPAFIFCLWFIGATVQIW